MKLEISTGNDAFREYPRSEVARILRAAAKKIEQGENLPFILLDINGNRVGKVTINRADAVLLAMK